MVSITVHSPEDRFGKLTDGGLGFEELTPNTFLFDSLTLACGSDGSNNIHWIYSQYNTIQGLGVSATYNNAQLGLSWLSINITKQGYYGCSIVGQNHKEVGVFDPSLTTGNSQIRIFSIYTYM